MARKDAFTGAKTVFMLFDAYVNTVAQEIGMERAVGLMTKTCEYLGTMQGQILKEQARIGECDPKTARSLMNTLNEDLGIKSQVVEESPKKMVTRAAKCPMYEAGQTLGMDAKTMETICRAGFNRYDDMLVKQLNPSLSFRLRKFRSTLDDFCEEEIVLG